MRVLGDDVHYLARYPFYLYEDVVTDRERSGLCSDARMDVQEKAEFDMTSDHQIGLSMRQLRQLVCCGTHESPR